MSSLVRITQTFALGASVLLASAGLLAFRLPAPKSVCKQQVLEAYHRLIGADKADRLGVYHLKFVSTSHYQAPGQHALQEAAVHGELYSQGHNYYFQTEQLRLWQDEHYVATVLPTQHTVFVTRVAPGQRVTSTARLLGLRDSLISLGSLQQCAAEQQGRQVRQHVQLAYEGRAGAQLQLKRLDFWLLSSRTLQQVRVEYRPGSAVQETTLRFPVQEWLTASSKVPIDARMKVLSPEGKLLPEYQGYHLVNQIGPLR